MGLLGSETIRRPGRKSSEDRGGNIPKTWEETFSWPQKKFISLNEIIISLNEIIISLNEMAISFNETNFFSGSAQLLPRISRSFLPAKEANCV